MHTVELTFAPALDSEVRWLWGRLQGAGLPGLADHPRPSNRPHLTLTEVDTLDPPVLVAAGALLASRLPLAIELMTPVSLPGRRAGALVLPLGPQPALRALQRDLHDLLASAGAGPSSWLAPQSWTPHVSLSLRLPPHRTGEALGLLADMSSTHGLCVSARSYDTAARSLVTLA